MADRNTVSVEIYGKSYVVRAGADQEYMRTVARYVEDQLRKVAAQSKAVDTQKIAVLTALNIASDLSSIAACSIIFDCTSVLCMNYQFEDISVSISYDESSNS